MLERIHVENYKCLRDVSVDLGDFTVLIGPNDSGKSSFLDVVKTLGSITRRPNREALPRPPEDLVWRKDRTREIVLEVLGTTNRKHFHYRLDLPADGKPQHEMLEWDGTKLFWTEEIVAGKGSSPHPQGTLVIAIATGQGKQHQPVQPGNFYLGSFLALRSSTSVAIAQALASSVEYHFDPEQLPKPSLPKSDDVLSPSGANIAGVLDVMQNSPDRSAFEAVQRSLHDAIPTLSGIVLPPATQQGGAKAIEFILAANGHATVTIPGSLASTGALLLTAYLTLAYSDGPEVLLFEEPENGLHPFRLQMVVDLLRKMSRGEIGNRKRQIIVTTHNPLLLNYAQPEEVRVFVRHPDEGTRVVPMTEVPDIDRLLKEFSLGELWYLLGEEKLFQEQRA